MPYIGSSPSQVAFLVDTFSGNGSTTAFTTSVAPANTASVLVAISGVVQDPSTYSVSGTTLTFSAAPPTGTGNISARYLGIPASGVTTTAYRTQTEFTATAGQTTFTPPSYTVGFIQVYRNGVLLGSADYTATNGTTVVLTTGATAGDLITTISFYVSSVLNAIPSIPGAVTPAYLSGNAPQMTVYTSGSGTYTVPTNAKALYIKMVGGGGGGSGAGTSGGGTGSAGGNTTFGSSLLTCNGGSGGVYGTTYSNSGTASIGAGATGVAIQGASGGGSQFSSYNSSAVLSGGAGGASPFGGAGASQWWGSAGISATANSGSGGGGAAQNNSGSSYGSGAGGAAGGYIEATITTLASSYSYSVGSGGSGGSAGTSGQAGGAGGSGVIIITAFF